MADYAKGYEYYKKEKEVKKAFSCAVALYPSDHYYMKDFQIWATDFAREFRNPDAVEYLNKSRFFMAKDYFDDFMLALESKREPKAQFWLPRRKKLMPICRQLQELEVGGLDELFISLPPRCGKTTLIMFFMCWHMIRNSELSNLYVSFSDGVANVFYNGLIEIFQDPYTYAWKEISPKTEIASTNAKELLLNLDRKKRYASFTGRSLYGTLNGACDCSGIQVADDLHSGIEEAMSPDRLQNAWNHVDNDYLPRGKQGSKRLWIGTRWSVADSIARRIDLLTNDNRFALVNWEVVNIPALNENDESNFDYEYGVGFNTDYYKQRRASFERNNDMASWLAQYQGQPIEREGTVFAPDDFRYFNGVLPEAEPDRIFMAVDPAWGGGDYVASPICYQYGDDLYIPDVIYDNGDKTITQPLIAHKAKKHNCGMITIEASKTTRDYAEGVRAKLNDIEHSVNLQTSTKHYTGTGKEQRIFDKAPDIREHMIFLEPGYRSKEYELFMQNVFSFKMFGKNINDDAPDSLSQAISVAFFQSSKIQILKRLF